MTITILRPSADVQNKFISESTGSVAFSLLDDAPDDDATYVVVPAGHQYPESYLWMLLTDLGALGSNQRVKATRIRCRIRMNASDPGHGAVVNARLWDDPKEVPHGGVDAFTTTSPSTFFTRSGSWHTGPASALGREWTRDLINRAYIHMSWSMSIGSVHENLRVSEVFVDVDVRDQPTVTGAAAANAATSTRPTITWSYNYNADFDPQVAYRVKVFSSLQYGATGFNPETSKPTWDSGEKPGPGAKIVVGTDLAVGSTYKAYVKAAQDFNGSRWYSLWAETSPFTIQPTPLATPTFTCTSDQTLPWLRNELRLQAALNALSAQQASLEDATTTGWAAGTLTTIANSAPASPPHGTRALQVTKITSAGTALATTSPTGSSGIPARAGVQYTARAASRTAVTARSVQVRLIFHRADGTDISSFTGSPVTNSSANWNAVPFVTATAPAETVAMTIELQVLSAAIGEVHHWDAIQVAPGTATAFGIGGMVGTSAYLLVERAWVSVVPKNLVHPQFWGGGDELRSADGFISTVTGSAVAYDTSERFHGQGSIRWDVNAAAVLLRFGSNPGDSNPAPTYVPGAVPGRQYTFSVYAKASSSFSSHVFLQPIDADQNAVGSVGDSGAITITTSWQRFQVTMTAPAGAVGFRPYLNNQASAVGVTVWVDAVQLELGATATALAQPGGRATEWVPVRGADEGELLVPAGSQFVTLLDHEVPPGYTVIYRAQLTGTDPASTLAIASDHSAYVAVMLDPPGQGNWVLGIVTQPLYRAQVKVTGPLEEAIHEEASKFFPLRPVTLTDLRQRPVIVSDFVGGKDGVLKLVAVSEDEFLLIERIIGHPGTLWLVYPDFGARYIRIDGDRSWTRRSFDPDDCPPGVFPRKWVREVSASFVETSRPR